MPGLSLGKGTTFHKNLNWSVKHQTVITCGEPAEICKHRACGVSLLLRSLCSSPPPHITPEQNHVLISKRGGETILEFPSGFIGNECFMPWITYLIHVVVN